MSKFRGLLGLAIAGLVSAGCVMQEVAESVAPAPVAAATAVADAMMDDIHEAKASRAGMSAERLERITAMTQRYVDENKLAGVVTLVARDGKIVHFEAVGNRGAEDDRPMTKDALFRIFSMTKPITAVAAMMLYEEGKFQLSDPVSDFVPELKELNVMVDGELKPAENPMTMLHLLTHTGGLSYGFNPQDPIDKLYNEAQIWTSKDLDEFAERIAKLPLAFEPGARWHYSVAVDITGLVVQRLSGMPFDVFLKERIFDPLGMDDTFFNVPADKLDRLLPNHGWDRQEEKLVQMEEESFVRYTDQTSLHRSDVVLRRRRPGFQHHGLSALLRNGAARRRTRRRAAAEPENRRVHDREPPASGHPRRRLRRESVRTRRPRLRIRPWLGRGNGRSGVASARFRRRIQLGRCRRNGVLGRSGGRHGGDRHDPANGFALAAARGTEKCCPIRPSWSSENGARRANGRAPQ